MMNVIAGLFQPEVLFAIFISLAAFATVLMALLANYPIAGLENELRRRLGDANLMERALRVASLEANS